MSGINMGKCDGCGAVSHHTTALDRLCATVATRGASIAKPPVQLVGLTQHTFRLTYRVGLIPRRIPFS
jgi:hypothetical protein